MSPPPSPRARRPPQPVANERDSYITASVISKVHLRVEVANERDSYVTARVISKVHLPRVDPPAGSKRT